MKWQKGKGEKKEMKNGVRKRDNMKEVHCAMRLRKRAGIKDIKLGGDTENGK